MGSRDQSLAPERDRPALRAAEDRARQLERGARRRLAGHDELARHLDARLRVSRARVSTPVDHRAPTRASGRPRRRSQASGLVASSAPATNSSRWKRRISVGRGRRDRPAACRAWSLSAQLGAGQAERRDGLVDRAVGLGPEVVLGDPRPPKRRPVVPSSPLPVATTESRSRARGRHRRAGRAHHMRPASRGSQRSASSVTLTACSTTDSACSLTCWIIEPAYGQNGVVRIILISVAVLAEHDLLDQRELHDVHPDLGVDDGAQGVEDRELGRARSASKARRPVARGRRRGWFGRGRRIDHDVGIVHQARTGADGDEARGRASGRPAGLPPRRRCPGRACSGRPAGLLGREPGPASEPSASKNSA